MVGRYHLTWILFLNGVSKTHEKVKNVNVWHGENTERCGYYRHPS